MKALSIRQPWADFIIKGSKRIENRSRHTKYRGPVLIHASLHQPSFDEMAEIALFLMHRKLTDAPFTGIENYGGIIGIADLVDVITESEDPWFTGPYGYVLENVRAIPFHPCKGKLGFWVPNTLPAGL